MGQYVESAICLEFVEEILIECSDKHTEIGTNMGDAEI